MDITKFKGVGSQLVMYKGHKHSKVKFKESTYFVKFEPKTADDFVLSTVRYAPTGYTTYMSGPSSYNVNNGYSLAKVTFFGYGIFYFYYTSYAEGNYDYLMISKLGQDWSNKTASLDYRDSSVYLHTSGKQSTTFTQGKFVDLDPTVEYSFWIMYKKDSLVNSNDDRGYFGISNAKPAISKRYYWYVDSALFVNENLQDSRTYSFTISNATQYGHVLFGDSTNVDSNDYRVFWYNNHLYFDSGSGRTSVSKSSIGGEPKDLLTYEVGNNDLSVYKDSSRKATIYIDSGYKLTGTSLGFVTFGSETLYFYEFKMYNKHSGELLKHYIPLSDGRTLYDVVSGTTLDTGKTFQVFKSYVETNQKGELIPYKD